MNSFSVIIPTFHSEEIITICIKSFEKFRPENIRVNYIVVENSQDKSYKDRICSLSENVKWINNPKEAYGSEANASAIELGMSYVKDDYVFTAHCDVCVTNESFYKSIIEKVEEGNVLVGMLCDTHPNRVDAIHILGLFTSLDILKKVDLYPKYKNGQNVLDVGDSITVYCRKKKLPHYCFKNTYNNPEIEDDLDDKWKALHHIPRCIDDDGDVMFLHLARGIAKTSGTYSKPNRLGVKDWVKFYNNEVSN